jgi:hypothetical protein
VLQLADNKIGDAGVYVSLWPCAMRWGGDVCWFCLFAWRVTLTGFLCDLLVFGHSCTGVCKCVCVCVCVCMCVCVCSISLGGALLLNQYLLCLDLGGNRIGDIGASSLNDMLHVNTALTLLDIKNNRIGDKGYVY